MPELEEKFARDLLLAMVRNKPLYELEVFTLVNKAKEIAHEFYQGR